MIRGEGRGETHFHHFILAPVRMLSLYKATDDENFKLNIPIVTWDF